MTKLQVRLLDGSRLVGTFNHTHTVADVRAFILACGYEDAAVFAGWLIVCFAFFPCRSRPGSPPSFVLKTAFPNQVIPDESVTLAAANLINAVVIQTLKA